MPAGRFERKFSSIRFRYKQKTLCCFDHNGEQGKRPYLSYGYKSMQMRWINLFTQTRKSAQAHACLIKHRFWRLWLQRYNIFLTLLIYVSCKLCLVFCVMNKLRPSWNSHAEVFFFFVWPPFCLTCFLASLLFHLFCFYLQGSAVTLQVHLMHQSLANFSACLIYC